MRFNLVIERLLISGGMKMNLKRMTYRGFNLVIERLLISGLRLVFPVPAVRLFQSRYRAASHFRRVSGLVVRFGFGRFNLVIERLLISGLGHLSEQYTVTDVSISLSSGFSFQGKD